MGNEAGNKFTWVINNFSSLQSKFYSDEFVVGGCKWCLIAFPKGHNNSSKCLALYLVVAGYKALPCGWRRHANFSLTVVNQLSEKRSQRRGERQVWFDQKIFGKGYPEMLCLSKLGFLVNNEVKIVTEVEVLEVIGKLDVSEESQVVTQPLKRIKLNVDGDVSSHLHKSVKESIDVSGFQVLPSQAESVKHIFNKHPNMAINFQAKNQYLRTICMNALLNLIQTLCQSLQDLSIDDLGQADNTLIYLKNSGFKVDWLERKLEEVKEKKIEEELDENRMQELEEELKGFKKKCLDKEALLEKEKVELKDMKQKCSDKEALLKKEKAKVLAARAPPLTLDDVV